MKSSSHGRITSAISVPSRFTLTLIFIIPIFAAFVFQWAFTFAKPTFAGQQLLFATTSQTRLLAALSADPVPQGLPYTQDFSALAHSAATFPNGWQGWQIGTGATAGSGTVFKTIAPTGDLNMTPNGSASNSAAGVYNFNGKLGTLSSGSIDPSIAFAIDTSGRNDVNITFDVMTIRNPYNGTTNTRINELDLQYRICSESPCVGPFTPVGAVAGVYQNNTTPQTSGTSPQKPETKVITLPADADNKANVQLRWVQRDVSGGGARPSFAVDNISVIGVAACSAPAVTLAPADQTVTYGDASVSFTSNAVGGPVPTVQWEMNSGAGFAPITNDATVSGADTTTLTIAIPHVGMTGTTYRAVFTNECNGTQSVASAAAQLTVTPLPITISPDPFQTKVYGDVDSLLTYAHEPPLVGSDGFSGSLSRTLGETVGSYAITPGTLSAGPNYSLNFTPDVVFAITAKILELSIIAENKVYDGTTAASFSCSLYGIVEGDAVICEGAGATFANDDVGVHAATANGLVLTGADSGNYSLLVEAATDEAEISPRPISVTAQPDAKVYDGTVVSLGIPIVNAGSIADGDTGGFTQTFETKHVGASKRLIPIGAVADGNAGNNYAITFVSANVGTITLRSITVTAVAASKIFDGNTSSTGIPLLAPGLVEGDLANFIQTYDTAEVGTGKTLTPSGTADDGNAGGNYAYTFVPVRTGVITAAYCFDGFLPPIGGSVENGNGGSSNDPVRTFKLHSTIPIKFTLLGGGCSGSPIVTGVHTLEMIKVGNSVDAEAAIDATPADAATTGNQFRLAGTEWHFNLDTKRTPGISAGTWLVKAALFDGSVRTVWISIKK